VTAALLELSGVGKSFPRATRRADRVRALASLLRGRAPSDPVQVLSGIDLCVRRGESVGIIGENGAGKSTLLKVITGVLAPTTGTVAVRGTVAALLELGAGFHPEFTGRDNVAMAGALMGFSDAELADKLDGILAFADIGRYIDEPVKHYSSGMIVRLGFALVAARRPDLLITDEVLAVGDEAFQRKCIRWIEDYLAGGGTLLLVSHSMFQVQRLCRHAVWIHGGTVRASGDVHRVTQDYLAWQEARVRRDERAAAVAAAPAGHVEFTIAGMTLNDHVGDDPLQLEMRSPLTLDIAIRSRDGRPPVCLFGVVRADGTAVYGSFSIHDGHVARVDVDGLARFRVRFPALELLPGTYHVRGHAMDTEALRVFDTVERDLIVRGKTEELGTVRLNCTWE
jgi:lipopolysaccharide transport system ATP-binding protein